MSKFKSRKFWVAVCSGALIVLNDGLGLNLPSEAVMSVAGIVIGYLMSQGYVDAQGGGSE